MNRTILIALASLASSVVACEAANRDSSGRSSADTVLIVLGNEPLDDSTPTVDMIARVSKAVEYLNAHPSSVLVLTGGPTAGTNSEARMMAGIAMAHGVRADSILLEEKARSTGENARLVADLVRGLNPRHIFVVSKTDHLQWAMRLFQQLPALKEAKPLACDVERAASIRQMEEYLKQHDSPRVRQRLKRFYDRIQGVD